MSSAFGVVCECLPLITGVILLALLATPRRASATARHQVLVVAAILCLAAPFLLRVMPAWQVLPRPSAPVMSAVASSYRQEIVSAPTGSTRLESSLPAESRATPAPAPEAYRLWFQVAAGLWLAGVAVALLRIACNAAALRRWVRGSLAAPQELLDLAATIPGPAVRLRIVEGQGDAFVYRVFSPVVVLPTSVASLPEEQVRMVLEHELAHVRRRDPLWAWVFEAFRVFYWFHPLAWVLVKRSHLAREMAADDLVLLDGRSPEAYAACLGAAALRHRTQAAPPLPALAFARQHPVLARLHAILDSTRRRSLPSKRAWLAVGLPMAVPALLLASLGFKAAAEAQPAKRATSRAIARLAPTPSLWTDLIEPLVTNEASEPQPAIAAGTQAQPPSSTLASPSTATPVPAPARQAPAPKRTVTFKPRGGSSDSTTYTVSLPENSPGHNAQAATDPRARGFGFRRPVPPTPPTAPSDKPTTPPSKPSEPGPSVDPGPVGGNPEPPVVTPPTEPNPDTGADPGSDPGSGENPSEEPPSGSPGEDPGDTPQPSFPSNPQPSFPTEPELPVETPEAGLPPAVTVVPCTSEEGTHFAVTWTVPAELADTWYPEVSGDQENWTSDPELLAVDGPIDEGTGMVRFIAILRETIPGQHRFLRMTDTPDWSESE